MNDTVRELLSYYKLVVPMLKSRKVITPRHVQWGTKEQEFYDFPAPEKKKDLLVIYIHGGGWNSGSPKRFHIIGQTFALAGYDCITLGYRKAPKFHYQDISDDIFQGYRQVQNYLAGQGRSYSKTVVIGSSAGAHLGAILCYDRERQAAMQVDVSKISDYVSMAGALDFSEPRVGFVSIMLKDLFGTKDRQQWASGEPITKLTTFSPIKLHLLHSRHDGLLSYEQAENFAKKAASLAIPVDFFEVTEAWNTHSLYSAGCFFLRREQSPTLDKVMSIVENC